MDARSAARRRCYRESCQAAGSQAGNSEITTFDWSRAGTAVNGTAFSFVSWEGARMAERNSDGKQSMQDQRTRNAQDNLGGKKRPRTTGSFKNDPDKSDAYFQSDPKHARKKSGGS